MDRTSCQITEVKFSNNETDSMTFTGYGAVFGNIDAYGDVILPGAFADSLAESKQSGNWPAMLLQHGGFGMNADDMTPIGIWTDIVEDGHGLKVTGKLADTPRGKEVYTLLKMEPRPAINGLSIGYIPKEFERRTKPEEPRRTLRKVHLVEISPVTFPANGKARIQDVKSLDELNTIADCEQYLREAGMSRGDAKHLIAKIKKSDLREAEDLDEIAETLRQRFCP